MIDPKKRNAPTKPKKPTARHKPKPLSSYLLLVGGIAGLIALGVSAAVWLGDHPPPPSMGAYAEASDALLTQMEQVAAGASISSTVFGTALVSERINGHVQVTAKDIPKSVCVTVGWKLVRKGKVTINGTTPQRVSAGRVTDLCHSAGSTADLAWLPQGND